MPEPSPVNPIPPVILTVALIAAVIEAIFSLAEGGVLGGPQAIGWRLAALSDYAFSPRVWEFVTQRQDFSPEVVRRFVTYPFVHDGIFQTLFGAALFLALGKFVAEIFGAIPTLLLLLVTVLAAALGFAAFADDTAPLYGLFPAVYGLIGAYTYLIWAALGRRGENQLQAFRLIAVLLGIQLVFAVLFGTSQMWIAEVSGFLTGFVASTVLAPGGWAALRARMRQR